MQPWPNPRAISTRHGWPLRVTCQVSDASNASQLLPFLFLPYLFASLLRTALVRLANEGAAINPFSKQARSKRGFDGIESKKFHEGKRSIRFIDRISFCNENINRIYFTMIGKYSFESACFSRQGFIFFEMLLETAGWPWPTWSLVTAILPISRPLRRSASLF